MPISIQPNLWHQIIVRRCVSKWAHYLSNFPKVDIAASFINDFLSVSAAAQIFNNSRFSPSSAALIFGNNNLLIDKSASIINNADFSIDKAASIFDSTSLSVDRAAAIIDNANLSVAKAASIFNSPNLSVNKAAAIMNDTSLSLEKAANIFENINLSLSKINSIITSDNISDSRVQEILNETDYSIRDLTDAASILYAIHDDWADNKLTSRDNRATTAPNILGANEFAQKFRPEWTTVSGSPSVSSGWLYLDGDPEEVKIASTFIVGSWETKWAVDALISERPVINEMEFIWKDSNNYYKVYYYMKDDELLSSASFSKMAGGSATTLIDLPRIYSAGIYTTRMIRDSDGNFEIFKDGVSQGTCTDTDITSCDEIHLAGRGEYNPTGRLHFDYLSVW